MAHGTMTGSGTIADPYIIEDWEDFMAATTNYPSDTYYNLITDLDANDYNDGEWVTTTRYISHITGIKKPNGSNPVIRNINTESTSMTIFYGGGDNGWNSSIKNIDLINIVGNNAGLFTSENRSNGHMEIENCTISGSVYGLMRSTSAWIRETIFKKCMLSLKSRIEPLNDSEPITFEKCSLYLTPFNEEDTDLTNTTFKDCRVEGIVNDLIKGSLTDIGGCALYKLCSASESIFALAIKKSWEGLDYGCGIVNTTTTIPVLYDTTLANMYGTHVIQLTSANVIGLTTTQLKDFETVEATGFPVVRAE